MKREIETINDYVTLDTYYGAIRQLYDRMDKLSKQIEEIEKKVKSNEDYLEGFEKAASFFFGKEIK